MRRLTIRGAILGLLVLMPALSASAQAPTESTQSTQTDSTGGVWSALAGAAGPQTVQLKDLNNSWQVFQLSGGSQESVGGMAQFYALFLNGGRDTSTYYSQGRTLTLAGETFLVAYHAQTKPLDYSVLMRSSTPPAPEPLTPDSKLSLCLLNIHSIGALNDIHSFDIDEVLSVNKTMQSMIETYDKGQQDAEKAAQVENNLRQLGLALMQFAQDHDSRFPPMKTAAAAKKALMRYARNEAIFTDPRSATAFMPNPRLSGKSLADIDQPASTPAFWDPKANDQGQIYVCFADGHVKAVSADEWNALKKAAKIP
ncbi:MAG TPA: hypothetical protein VFW40_11985 [Capsulimonadaceae bacterium]|nr:hypothetical protein [Capsulimonadaceae bacterium]